MDSPSQDRRPPSSWVLVLYACVSACLILIAILRFGPGLSPDSIGYLATARNLLAGRGMVGIDGLPVVVRPPLYPALLALVAGCLHTDSAAVAGPINAVLFGLIVGLSGLLGRSWTGSQAFALLAATAVLVSKPVFEVAVMAWSEPLFLCLCLLWLLILPAYIERPTRWRMLALALVTAAACLTRYIGVTLLLAGAVSLAWFGLAKHRVRTIASFVILASAPLLIWVARNVTLSGTAMGGRASSGSDLIQNTRLSLNKIVGWYLPPGLGPYHWPIVFALAAVMMAALVGVGRGPSPPRGRGPTLGPAVTFVVAYLLLLIGAASTSAIDELDNRLLSPLYAPMTLVAVYGLATCTLRTRGNLWKLARWVIAAVVAGWLVYSGGALGRNIRHRVRDGAGGYNTVLWRQSAIIDCLRTHWAPDSCAVYSNAPEALYALLSRHASLSPERAAYHSAQPPRPVELLSGRWPPEDQAWLVWCDGERRGFLFSVRELEAVTDMTPIFETADGAVFQVTRR